MLLAVIGNLQSNQNVWQSNKAFSTSVAAIGSCLAMIKSLVQITSLGTKGVTLTKTTARDTMEEATLVVAGVLGSFASKTGNTELFAKVDLVPSDISRLRDSEVDSFCQGIHDLAEDNLAALADYELVDSDLASLQVKIDAYNVLIGKPRQVRTANSAALKQLKAQLDQVRTILEEQVDGMMLKFKASQPDFFNSYMAARKVVDQPGGHAGKADAKVTDINSQPVAKAA